MLSLPRLKKLKRKILTLNSDAYNEMEEIMGRKDLVKFVVNKYDEIHEILENIYQLILRIIKVSEVGRKILIR